jgi:hypothetical protein
MFQKDFPEKRTTVRYCSQIVGKSRTFVSSHIDTLFLIGADLLRIGAFGRSLDKSVLAPFNQNRLEFF